MGELKIQLLAIDHAVSKVTEHVQERPEGESIVYFTLSRVYEYSTKQDTTNLAYANQGRRYSLL